MGGGIRFEKAAEAGLIMNSKIEMIMKMVMTNQSLPLKINSPAHRCQ